MSAPEGASVHADRSWPSPRLLALACGLAAFALYARTTSSFVLNEDVAEFQALSATHGISHAGYPLYVLALEWFHALPFATAAYRANLVSAVAAGVAVAMLALTCFEYTRSRLASVGAAATLALSYSLWSDATHAEVYAFTLALSASAFRSLLAYEATSRPRALFLCAVLTGCALTAHLGSLALAVVVLVTLVRQVIGGRAPARHVALAAVGLAIGLLPLLLIPLRDTPQTAMNYIAYNFDQYSVRHVEWAPDLVTRLRRAALLLSGSQYLERGWFHPFAGTFERLRLLLWHLLFNDLRLPGVLLVAVGFAASVRESGFRDRVLGLWVALVLVLVMAAAFPMVLTSFFLSGFWVVCLWLGRGLARAERFSRPLAWIGLALLIVSPFVRLKMRKPPALVSHTSIALAWAAWPEAWDPFRPDASWEGYARSVLATLRPRAELIVCWPEGTTLRYLQLARDVRPDVTLHWSCDSAPRIEKILRDAAARGTPVYSTIPIARLPQPWRWRDAGVWERGGLARYSPNPRALPVR